MLCSNKTKSDSLYNLFWKCIITPLLSLDRKVFFFKKRKSNACNSLHVSTTHVIMEGFCFTGVVTRLSPLWCSTIQVPEYTVDKTDHEVSNTTQKSPRYVCMEKRALSLTTTRNVGIQGVLQVLYFSPIGSRKGEFQ